MLKDFCIVQEKGQLQTPKPFTLDFIEGFSDWF